MPLPHHSPPPLPLFLPLHIPPPRGLPVHFLCVSNAHCRRLTFAASVGVGHSALPPFPHAPSSSYSPFPPCSWLCLHSACSDWSSHFAVCFNLHCTCVCLHFLFHSFSLLFRHSRRQSPSPFPSLFPLLSLCLCLFSSLYFNE